MFTALLNKLRRKKEFKAYEFQVVDFDLPIDGKVQYAQWLHPGEFGNVVRQENVTFYRQYCKPGDLSLTLVPTKETRPYPWRWLQGRKA